MDRRATYPGERMIILAEPRREGRAGPSAVVSVLGAAFGTWILLSAPQQPSLVPRAEAASLFAEQPMQPHRLNRAGPIQEAQANTVPKQVLGGEAGSGATPDKQTLKVLNADRKSRGLQPAETIDHGAVSVGPDTISPQRSLP